MTIFKICSAVEWAAAEAAGAYRGSAVHHQDGFIHFSTAEQAEETASRHFAGQGGLVLVAVDPAALGPALKWEFSSSRGEDFPHLYAPLTCDAMKWARPLKRGENDTFVLPDLDKK